MRRASGLLLLLGALALAACSSGPVRRVSEPTARIQQLTVAADGDWQVDLRVENFSSIPMRFDSLDLGLEIGGQDAGRLRADPALAVGPESAEVVRIELAPAAGAKLAVANALATGRSIDYRLQGRATAVPEDEGARDFDIEHRSALSPAPGLPGVLR